MKKFARTLFVAGLLFGVAGCGGGTSTSSEPSSEPSSEVATYLVSFWKNTDGGFLSEVEVNAGETVARPTDPTWEGYDFVGWYTDKAYTAEYDFDTPVNGDLDLYAKWNIQFVQDPTVYHLIGSFKNTAYPANWDVTDETTKLVDEDLEDGKNIFSIDIEFGQYATFKIKDMSTGTAWDDGVYWGVEYVDMEFGNAAENVQADDPTSDKENITMLHAGAYHIELETQYVNSAPVLSTAVIRINRTGDAVGEGVTQDADPGAVDTWGIIGGFNSWTEDAVSFVATSVAGTELWVRNMFIPAGTEFKVRANADWIKQFAFGGLNVDASAEGMLIGATVIADDPETEEVESGYDPNSNIKAAVDGVYSFHILVTDGVAVLTGFGHSLTADTFYLAGSFAVGDAWSNQVALTAGEPVVDETTTTYTYTATGLALVTNNELKAKSENTWEISFGTETGNLIVTEDGTYDVTLTIVVTEGSVVLSSTLALSPTAL